MNTVLMYLKYAGMIIGAGLASSFVTFIGCIIVDTIHTNYIENQIAMGRDYRVNKRYD